MLLGVFLTLSTLASAKHISIPVRRRQIESDAEHAFHSGSKLAARSSTGFASEPFYHGPGDNWYGLFDVGDSKNLSLLMDTASGTMYLKPGIYKPSGKSVDYHKNYNGPGFGFSNACKDASSPITSQIYSDTVSMGSGMVAQNLSFGVMDSIVNSSFPPLSGDGIMGLSRGLDFYNHGPGWIDKLCHQGQLNECKFGIAFGTQGEGALILGGVDEELFEGPLTPIDHSIASTSGAYFNVVINGTKTLLQERLAGLFDTGTNGLIIPASDARAIFDALGMQTVEQVLDQNDCRQTLTGYLSQVVGYYPCDNPPTLGFQILSAGSNSSIGPVFNIEPEAFKLFDNGNNSCTSVIVGQVNVEGYWDVGQAWMQGKYLDWDYSGLAAGVATLKNKAMP